MRMALSASSLTGSKISQFFSLLLVHRLNLVSNYFYYSLPRTFTQTVGTFDELKKYLQGYVETLARDDKKRNAK